MFLYCWFWPYDGDSVILVFQDSNPGVICCLNNYFASSLFLPERATIREVPINGWVLHLLPGSACYLCLLPQWRFLLLGYYHMFALCKSFSKAYLWAVLIYTFRFVINCILFVYFRSELSLAEIVPLPMSRLLLVVDYLLHFFYDLPPALVDQVRYFSWR